MYRGTLPVFSITILFLLYTALFDTLYLLSSPLRLSIKYSCFIVLRTVRP
jgi:hypothetical protein